MLGKKEKTILKLLKNNFPNITFYKEGEIFGNPIKSEYSPPYEFSWENFLILLKQKGFEITFIKKGKGQN